MATHSFQDPKLKKAVLVNRDTRAGDGIRITLMPNGALYLEPGGWPDGAMDPSFNCPVLLTPQHTEALWRFFDGQRVRDRMLDLLRRHLSRNPHTRDLIRAIDRHFDQADPPPA